MNILLEKEDRIYDLSYCEHDTGDNDGGWDGPACYNDNDDVTQDNDD